MGLFPQSSKTSIHKVTDIEDEIKSVSGPIEALGGPGAVVDQKVLRREIVQVSPRFAVSDDTRFKYLLSRAEHHPKLTERLWRIYANRPDLYEVITRYLGRCGPLRPRDSAKVRAVIKAAGPYQSITASFINLARTNFSRGDQEALIDVLKETKRGKLLQPVLREAVNRSLVSFGALTSPALRRLFAESDGWRVKSSSIQALDPKRYGTELIQDILNAQVRSPEDEVALTAASKLVETNLALTAARVELNRAAGHYLKRFGRIRSLPKGPCGVARVIEELVEPNRVDWRKVFTGSTYEQARDQATLLRKYWRSDPTAFVNALDVFNDLLVRALYAKRPEALGKYGGKIGGVLDERGRLRSLYPMVFRYLKSVHSARLRSALSHPEVRTTGRRTKRLSFSYIQTATTALGRALSEVSAVWPLRKLDRSATGIAKTATNLKPMLRS